MKLNNNSSNITKTLYSTAFFTSTIIALEQYGAIVVDSLLCCRYLSALKYAAIGLAFPIFPIMYIFISSISTGSRILCIQKLKTEDKEEITIFFSKALTLGLLVTVTLAILAFAFAGPLAIAFGAHGKNADLCKDTADYIRGYVIGIPAIMLNMLLAIGAELSGNEKKTTISSIVILTSNILLDIAAIALGYGVFGLGFASSVSDIFGVLILIPLYLGEKSVFKFKLAKIDLSTSLQIIKYGSDTIVLRITNAARPLLFNNILLMFGGTAELTAYSIISSLGNTMLIPITGASAACAIVFGFYYSDSNIKGIRETYRLTALYCLISTLALCIPVAIFSKEVAVFYLKDNTSALSITVFAIICQCILLFPASLNYIQYTLLEASKKTRSASIYAIFYRVIFLFLCMYAFGKLYGEKGIFISLIACEIVMYASYALYGYFRLHDKKLNRCLYWEYENAFPKGKRIVSMEINSINQLEEINNKVEAYFNNNNIDKSQYTHASVCIEEWICNIINRYNQSSHKHDLSIMIHMIENDGAIHIVIIDNYEEFSLTDHILELNSKSNSGPGENLDLQLIRSFAHEINYHRMLGTNCTFFEIS